jgi:hypothetical protein
LTHFAGQSINGKTNPRMIENSKIPAGFQQSEANHRDMNGKSERSHNYDCVDGKQTVLRAESFVSRPGKVKQSQIG